MHIIQYYQYKISKGKQLKLTNCYNLQIRVNQEHYLLKLIFQQIQRNCTMIKQEQIFFDYVKRKLKTNKYYHQFMLIPLSKKNNLIQEYKYYDVSILLLTVVNYVYMKSLKTQPTSYKDFVQQIGQVKSQKTITQYKIRQTPKGNNNSTMSLHSQSTTIWDKRSPSQHRITTQISAQKKLKSHNQSVQTQGESRTPTMSKKDKIMCYHKFITQATTILTQLIKTPVPQLLNNRISYIQYLQTLKAFKMIYENYQPYPNDLVSQLWNQYISGQNIGNFIITISSILGLYQSKQNETDKYLKHKYQTLRYTRMQLHKTSRQSAKQNQYSFMPQISERSRKIAESVSKSKSRHKKNKCQSTNPDQSLTERINGSVINHQRSKASIDYEQQYNFYGDSAQNSKLKTDYTGNKRSQILYERAKQKSVQKRENKTRNDIQFEKNMKQLTFKPTILKVKSKQKIGMKSVVRGQKNTISRMIRGRVQREVRKIINQKGVPYNQKLADRMRKQKYEQISSTVNLQQSQQTPTLSLQTSLQPAVTPITKINKSSNSGEPKVQPFSRQCMNISQQDLLIDVYLSQDHKQKLMIKKGENLEEVAIKFIQQHGIPYEKKEQLIQLLEVSINHALCPIDQLVEEEDQLASARTYHKREHYR